MCSISSMVSEGGSLERDFGIPVSDSASMVSTGMASKCSLQLYTLCQSPPRQRMFSLSCIFLFFTHPPSSSLLSLSPGGSKGVTPPPPTPAPFVLGEAGRQGLSLSLEQAGGTGAAVRDTVPHLHGARWLATVIIVPLRLGAAGPHWRQAVPTGPELAAFVSFL